MYYSHPTSESQIESVKETDFVEYSNTLPRQNFNNSPFFDTFQKPKKQSKKQKFQTAAVLSMLNPAQYAATIQFNHSDFKKVATFWSNLRRKADYQCKKHLKHLSAYAKAEIKNGHIHLHVMVRSDFDNPQEIFGNLISKTSIFAQLTYFKAIENFAKYTNYIHKQTIPHTRTVFTFGNFFDNISVKQRRELTYMQWFGKNYLTPEERKARYLRKLLNKPHFKPTRGVQDSDTDIDRENTPTTGNRLLDPILWAAGRGSVLDLQSTNRAIIKIYAKYWDST